MTPEEYELIREIFHEVSELPEPERERRIQEHDLGRELEAELRAILEHDDEDEEIFGEQRLGQVGLQLVHLESGTDPTESHDDARTESLPENVGAYRILRKVGEGGMGVVYEAEQVSPRRRVAVKVIRTLMPSEDTVKRFQREAEVLGMLQHPGIAHIYEAVLEPPDDTAPPFIAMEYIEGRTLVDYADSEDLALAERIELVARICDAVHHAHQRGILHRDLKPGNILVVQPRHDSQVTASDETRPRNASSSSNSVDAIGQPKILDFGIARITEDDVDSVTLNTSPGQIVGTLAYMSPEQAAGSSAELDTRSDVYALGVILYQLLAGRLPFATQGRSFAEVVRILNEQAPTPLGSIDRRLRGDVATITAKAMEKDRDRRYSSAAELAADLRRYLRNEPIVARPASGFYHLRKLIRRHRALSATLLIALLAIFGLTAWALLNADRAKAREREISRLSDQRELRILKESQDALWPPLPDRIPELEGWLDRAEDLVERIPEHEGVLQDLQKRGRRIEEDGEEVQFEFPGDPRTAWWHETLAALIGDLKEFASDSPIGETVGGVRARLDAAREIDRLESSAEGRESWEAAREAIRSHPDYGGLELPMQPGLMPLGPDPQSGLWEFWHIQSGDRPEQDSAGRWVVGMESGLVLVLLPGGTFQMGATTDPAGPNYDPDSLPNESPPHDVTLSPFFASKYEMTQRQWDNHFGENPAVLVPATPGDFGHTHPVQQVSWLRSVEAMKRLGLSLPTEAQWEYACRAGTDTPWYCGDRQSVLEVANVADQRFVTRFAPQLTVESWDDGFAGTAPVGSFDPNGFGLHDTLGNVWEWCRDAFATEYDKVPARPGDGLRTFEANELVLRVQRGGSFFVPSSLARCAARARLPEVHADLNIGVRPVMNFMREER
ncbi:MAG: bifunctional serine/threonine-protein kinase/formylglycine-generating enzyme family protein [Planctomycetota bacterium]